MTVKITENLTLNGSQQGSTNTLTLTGINDSFRRIVSCPASNTTTIASFNSNVYGAAGAIDVENARYIRVTNLDSTNPNYPRSLIFYSNNNHNLK